MPAFLSIPKAQLVDLYLNQRLSSRRIAKILNCAYSTIDRKIRLANLPIRNLAQAHIIYPRMNFSGNFTEKAYLIGFRVGDLRVRKFYKNSETIHADCGSTKIEQINLIKQLFNKYGRVWVSKPNMHNCIQIECFLNNSFNFLLPSQPQNWIFMQKRYFFSFLAGFTDADGSIFVSNTNNQAIYSLGNYNVLLLKKIQKYLGKFGISTPKITKSPRAGLIASHGYQYNNDYWTLRVSRKASLVNLLKLICPHLKHATRITQMTTAIANIKTRNKLYGRK